MKFIKERRHAALRNALVLAWVALALLAAGIQVCAAAPFSFVVIGDTRTEPYLTGGMEQAQAMENVLKERFHDNPVRLFFDPTGLALTRAEIQERGAVVTLYYRDGWPRTIVKLANSRARVLMRERGRKWVFNRIVSAVDRGAADPADGALFVVHGGDIPVFGYQGTTLDESPYWQLFDDELLSRLPPPGKNLGLPGLVLAAVGNHETWHDENISGLLTAMPWLKTFGLSEKRRIYAVTFRNCRFIFLDTGGYKRGYGDAWTSRYPGFDAQMAFLKNELSAAKKAGAEHVFIVYHKPSFVKVGHDSLMKDQNPHQFIKEFAKDLNIVVFNSHSHSTEHYLVDGVHYLVIGAGGAPQAFDFNDNPSPEAELYWKGQNRVEEYNYLQVTVNGPNIKGTIHRFRPADTLNPFSVVEVFNK